MDPTLVQASYDLVRDERFPGDPHHTSLTPGLSKWVLLMIFSIETFYTVLQIRNIYSLTRFWVWFSFCPRFVLVDLAPVYSPDHLQSRPLLLINGVWSHPNVYLDQACSLSPLNILHQPHHYESRLGTLLLTPRRSQSARARLPVHVPMHSYQSRSISLLSRSNLLRCWSLSGPRLSISPTSIRMKVRVNRIGETKAPISDLVSQVTESQMMNSLLQLDPHFPSPIPTPGRRLQKWHRDLRLNLLILNRPMVLEVKKI